MTTPLTAEKSRRKTAGGHPLQAGQSGQPAGRPKAQEVQAVCAALVDDPMYRRRLVKDLRRRKVAPVIEAMLWHYAYGVPKQTVAVESQARVPLFALPAGDTVRVLPLPPGSDG
jgi:hypothetical protein